MNKMLSFAAAALALMAVLICGCEKDPNENPDTDTRSAIERYWADDYTGEYGIQQGESTVNGKKVPRMFLGGKLLYTVGMNCYNLFVQCWEADNMRTTSMEKAVKVLEKESVPVVRFSCSPFYAHQFHFYFDNKEKYLANLDTLASWCDRAHVGLIPSVFFAMFSVPEYYGEELKAFGDVNSKTYAHMLSYTTDVVNVLKKHKCLFMWEFANEGNLQCNIAGAGFPDISATDLAVAYKGFADLVESLDEHHRVIASGNSIMRNAQWHLLHDNSWQDDSYAQYVEITDLLTPKPMTGMSEHIYDDSRVFSDKGQVNRNDQVAYAKQAADELGNVYYVGEFTGPPTAKGDSLEVRRHLIAFYANKVQISLMWNYALKADIEWSFKADTPYGNMAFNLMREYNERYKTVKE